MSTFKEYSFQDYKEVYKRIDAIITSLGYKYYLIGANARDIHLYRAGLRPTRGTADIDFAVMIPSEVDYNNFMKQIIENGFQETNHQYRVIYIDSNTVVDILPYGKIAQEYTLNFNARDIELSVLGFEEVGNDSQEFKLEGGFSIPISSAHGLIILKLISWNERKERNKDLKDIRSLLDAAWALYQDELYKEDSEHFDLLDADNFDVHKTAAKIMGRKMKPLLDQCKPLNKAIRSILEIEIANPSLMTAEMSIHHDTEIVIGLLENLLAGIKGE